MATHSATISWTLRDGDDFCAKRYSRVHHWQFDGGVSVPASPATAIVPLPWSEPANVDPEEAYVAALSSCHMLCFLTEAATDGIEVLSYNDEAEGVLEQNAAGQLAITRVTLRPDARYGANAPTPEQAEALHHRAHERCFIANSVQSDIITDLIN